MAAGGQRYAKVIRCMAGLACPKKLAVKSTWRTSEVRQTAAKSRLMFALADHRARAVAAEIRHEVSPHEGQITRGKSWPWDKGQLSGATAG